MARFLDTDNYRVIAASVAKHPLFPDPIKKDQMHRGWRDGVYRDDAGVRWELTPPVVGQGRWLPDLSDDGTKGVLMAKARQTWGCPHLSISYEDWSDGQCGWAPVCDYEVEGLSDLYVLHELEELAMARLLLAKKEPA